MEAKDKRDRVRIQSTMERDINGAQMDTKILCSRGQMHKTKRFTSKMKRMKN